MSVGGRIFAATERLLLPPLLTTRILKNSRQRPVLKEKIWRCLPWIVMLTFVQMVAEIEGYLKGRTFANGSTSAVGSHPTELN
jgi:hypothetical protein